MGYQVNEKELAAVSSLAAPDRYSYFVRKVADWKELWSIADASGWRLHGDDSGNAFVPVWPAEAYARACCTGPWEGCEPRAIALDVWMGRWIPGLRRDGRGVSVFSLPSGLGVCVDPDRLASDLEDQSQQLIDLDP